MDPTAFLIYFKRILLSAEKLLRIRRAEDIWRYGHRIGNPRAQEVGCLQQGSAGPLELYVISDLANGYQRFMEPFFNTKILRGAPDLGWRWFLAWCNAMAEKSKLTDPSKMQNVQNLPTPFPSHSFVHQETVWFYPNTMTLWDSRELFQHITILLSINSIQPTAAV